MLDLTKILEVGDKVQTADDGVGEVKRISEKESNYYPIWVDFENGESGTFNREGFFMADDEDPTCTLRPVGFNNWEEFAESKKPKS